MTRVRVEVAGSRLVIGSPRKHIGSLHLCVCVLPSRPSRWATPLPSHFVHMHQATWIYSIYNCCTETEWWREILHLKEIAPRRLVQWHHAKWETIPECIALVILSSSRIAYFTSQQCWGVFAAFRSDLNKTWKVTEPAVMYEYKCHLWQRGMADGEISIH